MASTLSQAKSVLVDISGTLQVEGGLSLNANSALNQSVAPVALHSLLLPYNLNGFSFYVPM